MSYNHIFYHSIDRILPRCFFCLENKTWEFLMREYHPNEQNTGKNSYYLPQKYVILPIKEAIKHIFLSCIAGKYKYLLIDTISKYVFCITSSLNEFLIKYYQPKHCSEIVSVNNTRKYQQWFKESIKLGFIQFSNSPFNNILEADFNAKTLFFRKQFAEVELLKHRGSSLCFSVKDTLGRKMFVKQLLNNGKNSKDCFAKKMLIIKKFHDFDCFTKLLYYNIDSMFYITQYVEGNNLEEVYLKMPINTKIDIIFQIIKSVALLHSKNIVHGDLHLGQFLLLDNGNIKMIDYDMVADITDKDTHTTPYMGATCEYIEPESICRNPFIMLNKPDLNFKAEIYRLGVLIFTIIYGTPPFLELTWEMLYNAKKSNEIQFDSIDNNGNLIPNEIITIMNKCLFRSPEKRFSSACEIISYLTQNKQYCKE